MAAKRSNPNTQGCRAWIAWQLRTVPGTTRGGLITQWTGTLPGRTRNWATTAFRENLAAGFDRDLTPLPPPPPPPVQPPNAEPGENGEGEEAEGEEAAEAQQPAANVDRDGDFLMANDAPGNDNAQALAQQQAAPTTDAALASTAGAVLARAVSPQPANQNDNQATPQNVVNAPQLPAYQPPNGTNGPARRGVRTRYKPSAPPPPDSDGSEESEDGSSDDRVLDLNDYVAVGDGTIEAVRPSTFRRIEERKHEWPDGQLPDRDLWTASRDHIGEGGEGRAILWLKKRDDGVLIDRVVAKNVFKSPNAWLNWTMWWGNPRDTVNRQVLEVKVMELFRGKRGSQKVMSSRAHYVDNSANWFRIYMDYCAYGSLQNLIEQVGLHAGRQVPEPFLWNVANDLVEACLLLKYSDAEVNTRIPGWSSLVHRDIKLDNILLDDHAKDSEDFPAYLTARLADFGFVAMTDEHDPDNPMLYNNGKGTKGWRAPEQIRYVSDRSLVPLHRPQSEMKFGERTNAFGIGMTLIRLMGQDRLSEEPTFHTALPVHYRLNPDYHPRYSQALRDLAERCTRYYPEARPTLDELKQHILYHTQPGDMHDEASGMRSQANIELGSPEELRHPADKYVLGMAQ